MRDKQGQDFHDQLSPVAGGSPQSCAPPRELGEGQATGLRAPSA
jgi:hypothetical protein